MATTVSVRAVLGTPGARPMVAWSLLGRFGFAMINLSLLIFVRAETGSYAIAGLMSAASLVGTAAGVVGQGRLIDRYGPTRPLLGLVVPHTALAAAVIAGIATGLAPAMLGPLIAAQCTVLPAVAVASRTMWTRLVPAGPGRDAAYSYEAISFELCWLLGPAAAGLLATLLWPGTALLAALTLTTVAAAGFALTAAVQSNPGLPPPVRAGKVGHTAVDRWGLATLLIATCGFGLAIGFIVVAVIAGTAAGGAPELVGILLAGWSVSSMIGGLAQQRRPWPRQLTARLPVHLAILALTPLIPVALDAVAALGLLMVLSGLTLVPQITAHNTVLDEVVPRSRLTEAYGWLTTAIVMASAAGQAIGGLVIERYDHRAGLLAATVCVLPLALVVWIQRRHLTGGTRPSHTDEFRLTTES